MAMPYNDLCEPFFGPLTLSSLLKTLPREGTLVGAYIKYLHILYRPQGCLTQQFSLV